VASYFENGCCFILQEVFYSSRLDVYMQDNFIIILEGIETWERTGL
jgi:hypothetical protein